MSSREVSYQENTQQSCCLARTIENLKMNILRSWRGTGKDGSQFLWRRNLEGGVMSKLKAVDSKLFSFSLLLFYFLFKLSPFLFLEL